MAETAVFDVLVVGLGMLGSAALRHISRSGSTVVGVGPPEPLVWSEHEGAFASHYDEGRLTRIVDKDIPWATMAARSIARYDEIHREAGSGPRFHFPVGSLRVTPFYGHSGDSMIAAEKTGRLCGAKMEVIKGAAELSKRFPYMRFSQDDVAIMEWGGAGYINPRGLVRAQIRAAERHGARVIRHETRCISLDTTRGLVEAQTEDGVTVLARSALVAADAWTNDILPPGIAKLDLRPQVVTTLLAELGEAEVVRLAGMPSLIHRLPDHPFLHSVYVCPPTLYPDGRTYLKIGGTAWTSAYRTSATELRDWFRGSGEQEEAKALEQALRSLFPNLEPQSVATKPCVVTYTAHGYPYIDAIDENKQLFVAVGGSGAAAKSSDEIGRMAALLVANKKWNHDMDPSLFRAVHKSKSH